METALNPGVDWNPYDYGLLANPHDVFRQIREGAQLYYNAEYDFYAVSHYFDCVQGLWDLQNFQSGKGVMLEQIRAKELPRQT